MCTPYVPSTYFISTNRITWSSDGQVAPLQLDLIVRDGESSDESVNLQLRHASAGNVERDASPLNGDLTGRSENQSLDGVVVRVDHVESRDDVDQSFSGSGFALNDKVETHLCGERKGRPLNRGGVNES